MWRLRAEVTFISAEIVNMDARAGGAHLVELRSRVCAQFVHWVRPIYARKLKIGDSRKSKRKCQKVLSRLASFDNASDSTTGLCAPTLVTNEIWLGAQEYPS